MILLRNGSYKKEQTKIRVRVMNTDNKLMPAGREASGGRGKMGDRGRYRPR